MKNDKRQQIKKQTYIQNTTRRHIQGVTSSVAESQENVVQIRKVFTLRYTEWEEEASTTYLRNSSSLSACLSQA